MAWNVDGTYTWGKSGETMSAAKMASDFNMTQPAKKKLQTTSAQPRTQQTASVRPGMQQDGTYVTPSGLTFPKEYAAGIAAGRPYRIDQQNGEMTVTWQDENPFQNKAKAGASGQAMLDQKTLATDPSLSFQDQSGKTFATVSSPYDMSDVQVQRIYSDKSGNEYATITSSVAGGTKVDVKRSPQIGSGNVFLAGAPQFDPIKGSQLPYGMGIIDRAQQAKYDASVPSYKSSMDSSMPLFGVLGIGSSSITPNKISNSILDYATDNNPFKNAKDPVGSFARGSLNSIAGIPSYLTGGIAAGERYTMAGINRLQGKTGGSTTMTPLEMISYDAVTMSSDMNQAAKTDPWGTIGALGGSMVIAGGVSKAIGRLSGVVRTVGRQPLVVEKYGYTPEVGYPINPKGTNPKTVLKSFEENTLIPKPIKMSKSDTVPYVPKNAILPNTKLVGSERLMYTGWESDVPVKVGKKWTIKDEGKSETQGIYGAPVVQTSYTKMQSGVSDAVKGMFGSDMSFGLGNKPTMIATTVDKILPVPKSMRTKIGSKEFIETSGKPGVAYADLYKAEYQVILPYGNEVVVTGKNYYVKFGGIGDTHFLGRRIPITEQKTTGIRNIFDTSTKPGKSKSSPYSYDITKSSPTFNTAYMGKPVTSKKSEYSDINVYKSSITPIKTTYRTSTKSSTKSSTVSNSGSRTSSPKTTGSSMNLTSIIGSNPYTKSTPKYKTTKTTTTYTGSPDSKTTSVRTLDYTPSGVSYRPTSTPTTSITTGTPTTSKYTPPKYIPPTYKTPTYKIPKFELNETKPVKSKKYKPGSLFEFKEKTKSRSIWSILGGDLKPSRKKLILTKNKPRIVKKKIVRRKR